MNTRILSTLRRGVTAALLGLILPLAADAQATSTMGTKPAGRVITRTSAGTVDTTTLTAAGKEAAPTLNIEREVFSYRASGRRDPYESLMANGDLRPLVSELRLTAVAFDPVGNNSVAILRDVITQAQYRVRVGQSLGRLRIANIRQKAVIFSINEFGFSRQDTLPLSSDSTTTRTR